MADEIEAASQPSTPGGPPTYGFFEGPGGTGKKEGSTSTTKNGVFIQNKTPGGRNRTDAERAATLAHEWIHVRQIEGHPGYNQVTPSEAQNNPYEHFKAYDEALWVLCELWLNWDINELAGDTCGGALEGEYNQKTLRRLLDSKLRQWSREKIECDAESWPPDENGMRVPPDDYAPTEPIC